MILGDKNADESSKCGAIRSFSYSRKVQKKKGTFMFEAYPYSDLEQVAVIYRTV